MLDLARQLSRDFPHRRQPELGSQRVAVTGISLQQSNGDQVIHALRKGGSACTCCRQQRRLSARNSLVKASQDRQRPSPRSDIDESHYVHYL
jgi:hypothetical protein